MRKYTKYLTVWHSPIEYSLLAPKQEVINRLTKEYGMSPRVAVKSILPNHWAIEVPTHQAFRAGDACVNMFGRTKYC